MTSLQMKPMLVITRNPGENFVLVVDGKVIAKVNLLGITRQHGDQLKLGIESPGNVKIYRSELWDKIEVGKLKKEV